MATKNNYSNYKEKNWASNNETFNHDNQYRNFNMNQNHRCYNMPVISSSSKFERPKKNFNDYCNDNYQEKGGRQGWNNYSKNNYLQQKPLYNYKISKENSFQENKKYGSSGGYSTSSLSMNMQNYENDEIEESKIYNNNNNKWKKVVPTKKQQKQDPFSFPRQPSQENEKNVESQIMPFKASQKLLDPTPVADSSSELIGAKKGDSKKNDSWDTEFAEYYFKLDKNENYWIPPFPKAQNCFYPNLMKINHMIYKSKYLSSGTYGSVSLCSISNLKQEFVVKTLKNVKDIDGIEAEINVYTNIQSPYIPRLFFAGFDKNEYYTFVTEYISGQTLSYHIMDIPLKAIKFIAYEIACGVQCLHDKNLSHGDLKPNNIALTPDGHVKLLDFGHSRDISMPSILPKTHIDYQAPEIVQNFLAGSASDWWSYGCILVALHQKRKPFDIKKKIDDPIADDFIKKLLIENPDERLKNVFEHEYLKTVDPKPSYIPGIIPLQQRNQPFEEPNLFFLPRNVKFAIKGYELLRFPSKKLLKSFE